MVDTARFLREAREWRDLTQSDLARLAHTAQPSISRIECGAQSPTIRNLQHLLAAMGLELRLGFEEKPE